MSLGAISSLTANFWTLVDSVKSVYTAAKSPGELAAVRWATWQAEGLPKMKFYTHPVAADSYDEKTHPASAFTEVAKTEPDIAAYIAANSDAVKGSLVADIATHCLYPKTTKGNYLRCYTFAGDTTPGLRGGQYVYVHFPPSVNKAVLTAAVLKGMRAMVATVYGARSSRPAFVPPIVRALVEWSACGGQTASKENKIDYAFQYAWRDTLTANEAIALRADLSAIIQSMATAGSANKGKGQGQKVKAVKPTLTFFNGIDT